MAMPSPLELLCHIRSQQGRRTTLTESVGSLENDTAADKDPIISPVLEFHKCQPGEEQYPGPRSNSAGEVDTATQGRDFVGDTSVVS